MGLQRWLVIALVTLALPVACSEDKHVDKPFAVVRVTNATDVKVQIFECPDCGSKGGGIVHDSFVEWTISNPIPLSFPVSIRGRRVICKQPASPPPTDRANTIYHLAYKVTQAGNCVVTNNAYAS